MTTEEVLANVLKALDEIRPFLNSDGGDISLVEIEEDKHVKVRLEGACTSCSVNQMTLKADDAGNKIFDMNFYIMIFFIII